MGFTMTVLDIKQTFVQGIPLKRERGPILVQPCEGLPIPASSIVELRVALYGLDDAPYQWRQTLLREMQDLGFERSLLDACVWLLRDGQARPKVMALLDVDDIILSGKDKDCEPILKKLRARFKIGKEERGTTSFCGRRLQQDASGKIQVDMQKYMEKVAELAVDKKDKRDRQLTLHEHEGLRSLVYNFAWLGREVRPEMAGASSMLASRLAKATVADLLEANALVRYLKATADRKLIVHPTPVEDMHWLAFSDAGGTLNKEAGELDDQGQAVEATQGAWVLLSCHGRPTPGSTHNVTPVMWKSTKLRRKHLCG
eukprot:5076010-Amphidinium_carterae.1